MAALTLNDRDAFPHKISSGLAFVYTKATWSASWDLRPDLIPVSSAWVAAPSVSSAALEYRYGRVLLPGEAQPKDLSPITSRGYWVLIRWIADNGTAIDWLGYAESAITKERFIARDDLPEAGKQTIPCIGMIRTLDHAIIDSTVYADPDDEEMAIRSGGTGTAFNAGMRGNRTKDKRKLADDGPEAYVFAHPNDPESEWWSIRDMVEHLARFHLPTPNRQVGESGVPWEIINVAALPDWYADEVDTDLRSVSEILNELLTPAKMLGWGVGISGDMIDDASNAKVSIAPFSLLAEPLIVPLATLPGNANQVSIACVGDPLTRLEVDTDSSNVYDQVIVQGPREIAVCTLSAHPVETSTHVKGWEVQDEWKYSDGAKFVEDFAGLSTDEKRKANERFRTSGKMADVYSLYRFREDWNGKMGEAAVFEPNLNQENEAETYVPSPTKLELLDWLPLYAEVDYAKPINEVDESGGLSLRKPVFALRALFSDGEISNERLYTDQHGRLTPPDGLAEQRPIRIVPRLEDGFNVRIVTEDAPQHALAGKEFVGNAGDLDQETIFGNLHHKGWEWTLAFRGDRRPRYAMPSPAEVAGLDVVRRKIITFDDDSLMSVWIMPGSFVGWKSESVDPQVSPGGRLRDPIPALESLCRLAAKQYLQPRSRVTIKTGRRLDVLTLGTMITTVDSYSQPVNAVITEARIDAPITDSSDQRAGLNDVRSASQSFVASPFRANLIGLVKQFGTGTAGRRTPDVRAKLARKRRESRDAQRAFAPRDKAMLAALRNP